MFFKDVEHHNALNSGFTLFLYILVTHHYIPKLTIDAGTGKVLLNLYSYVKRFSHRFLERAFPFLRTFCVYLIHRYQNAIPRLSLWGENTFKFSFMILTYDSIFTWKSFVWAFYRWSVVYLTSLQNRESTNLYHSPRELKSKLVHFGLKRSKTSKQ